MGFFKLFIILLGYLSSLDSELVDIGGRTLYINCAGEGSPTVVFISGRTDRSDIWSKVFDEMSKKTHVCAYDRPGTVTIVKDEVKVSRSSSVPQPVTPKEGVQDLHSLLQAVRVPGPYILVAHSYGGLIARLFASLYPNEVVGLVLVDTLTEKLFDDLNPEQQALWIKLNSNYSKDLDQYTVQERTDFLKSFDELRRASIINVPTVVLMSDQPYDFQDLIKKGILPVGTPVDFGAVVFNAQLNGQIKMAKELKAKVIPNTHSGHYIQVEQPQLVIEAINDLIREIRH